MKILTTRFRLGGAKRQRRKQLSTAGHNKTQRGVSNLAKGRLRALIPHSWHLCIGLVSSHSHWKYAVLVSQWEVGTLRTIPIA